MVDSRICLKISALLVLMAAVDCRLAPAEPSNRIANINKAASEIAGIQKRRGADGAFAEIHACYSRELAIAKSLTRGLESCMTQDIIVSKITADFYSRISAEVLKKSGGSDPRIVIGAMLQRVMGTMDKFKVSKQDAGEFMQLVQKHGLESYGGTRFPKEYPAKK
jgi:hypothetical protein